MSTIFDLSSGYVFSGVFSAGSHVCGSNETVVCLEDSVTGSGSGGTLYQIPVATGNLRVRVGTPGQTINPANSQGIFLSFIKPNLNTV